MPLIVTPETEDRCQNQTLVTFPFVDAGDQVFIVSSRCVEGYERCSVSAVVMYQNECVWMDGSITEIMGVVGEQIAWGQGRTVMAEMPAARRGVSSARRRELVWP